MLHGKTVVRAGFGIYHGAAQNDDLNAGLESDAFRVKVNQSIPLSPAFQQSTPDLSGVTVQKQAVAPARASTTKAAVTYMSKPGA